MSGKSLKMECAIFANYREVLTGCCVALRKQHPRETGCNFTLATNRFPSISQSAVVAEAKPPWVMTDEWRILCIIRLLLWARHSCSQLLICQVFARVHDGVSLFISFLRRKKATSDKMIEKSSFYAFSMHWNVLESECKQELITTTQWCQAVQQICACHVWVFK